jgi:hypothetical protein
MCWEVSYMKKYITPAGKTITSATILRAYT